MKRPPAILTDALILFVVSTAFVLLMDALFAKLKDHDGQSLDTYLAIIRKDAPAELEAALTANPESTTQRDPHGRTLLMLCATANLKSDKKRAETDTLRASVVPILLRHGADPKAKDKDGWTALKWAQTSRLPKTQAALETAE